MADSQAADCPKQFRKFIDSRICFKELRKKLHVQQRSIACLAKRKLRYGLKERRRPLAVPAIHSRYPSVRQRILCITSVRRCAHILSHGYMSRHRIQTHLVDAATAIAVFLQSIRKIIHPFNTELIYPVHIISILGRLIKKHSPNQGRILIIGL